MKTQFLLELAHFAKWAWCWGSESWCRLTLVPQLAWGHQRGWLETQLWRYAKSVVSFTVSENVVLELLSVISNFVADVIHKVWLIPASKYRDCLLRKFCRQHEFHAHSSRELHDEFQTCWSTILAAKYFNSNMRLQIVSQGHQSMSGQKISLVHIIWQSSQKLQLSLTFTQWAAFIALHGAWHLFWWWQLQCLHVAHWSQYRCHSQTAETSHASLQLCYFVAGNIIILQQLSLSAVEHVHAITWMVCWGWLSH